MTTRLFLLLGAMFLAVACGGGETSETPESSAGETPTSSAVSLDDIEGCDLVTREQVSTALGAQVGAGEDLGLVGCTWRSESGMTVDLQVYAGSMLVPATCDGQKFLVSGQEQDVPGLGDSALWGSSGNLVVCSSRAVLKVDVENTPNAPAQDRDVAIQIARIVLDRLG